MFLIDVQPPQRDAVEASLTRLGATDVMLLPISRGRVVGLKRDPSNKDHVPANRVGGEHQLTHRLTLDPTERIVAGRFWPPTPSASPKSPWNVISPNGGCSASATPRLRHRRPARRSAGHQPACARSTRADDVLPRPEQHPVPAGTARRAAALVRRRGQGAN